jgi:predicted O-methyltransferase YrrM
MKKHFIDITFIFIFILSFLPIRSEVFAQDDDKKQTLDERVISFLEKKKSTWRDMNVPASDGKLLYDLIVDNGYKNALEIGTSTGHSGIWIAWALSKTGGKLITIEINERRYQEAVTNFEEAGLSEYIDARLADAHELVKELEGPFDFVFCDADKGWYKNYFMDVNPKLIVGGCYTAHNVTNSFWKKLTGSGTVEFYNYIITLKNMETTVNNSGNGLSISYKRSAN